MTSSVFPKALTADIALILDTLSEGVYVCDVSGRIVLVNRAAAATIGYDPAELLGRIPHEVMHHTRADGTAFPIGECPLATAGAEGRPYRADEDTFWRRDGSSFPVEYESQPLQSSGDVGGFIVTFRDITARKRSELRLRELLQDQFALARAEFHRAQLSETLAQTPAIICVTRGPGHIIETVNEKFTERLGGAVAVGKAFSEAFSGADEQMVSQMDLAYHSGKPQHASGLPLAVHGPAAVETRFFDYAYQPLRDDTGYIYGLMMHAVDVTDGVLTRRALEANEAALEARNEDLSRLAEALERSNQELDAFAYAASHDLRAPLRGIANLAQWIEEDLTSSGELRSETSDMLGLMRSRMHRMEALIEGILEYSRAGRLAQSVEPVDVRGLVREVVDLLAPPQSVTIEIGELPSLITSRLPLQQIFINLVGNALKHSDRPDAVITISAKERGRFFEFIVADNGPGIPPEFHQRVWGIFQTLAARDQVEGAGIGLSLVKKLVEAHGGQVGLESESGKGATFSFTWPKETPIGKEPQYPAHRR
jgi:PAS domain S-box-containing protein